MTNKDPKSNINHILKIDKNTSLFKENVLNLIKIQQTRSEHMFYVYKSRVEITT